MKIGAGMNTTYVFYVINQFDATGAVSGIQEDLIDLRQAIRYTMPHWLILLQSNGSPWQG